jgi:hypothetical protein
VTTTTTGAAHALHSVIRRRLDTAARAWFDGALAAVGPASAPGALLEPFTVLSRRLGRGALQMDPAEIAGWRAAGIDWPVAGALDELGRVVLVLHAATRWEPDTFAPALEAWFRQGDSRERQAILRALPLLPEPERVVALGVEACRSSIQPVFEAIACENPFPARHFPEPNFNQMVLKALFTGVPLARILGLQDRVTAELERMARDFASERRAAGRPVPADIGRLIGAGGHQP